LKRQWIDKWWRKDDRTEYLVLNQRGNGLTEGGGEGQNWISCSQSKRQWIDIRRIRGAKLDILFSIKEAMD
jgi:hypothetical protein